MLFALLYAFCLIIPGWTILSLFRITGIANGYLYPIASLGFFIGLSVLFSLADLPVSWFSTSYFLFVFCLLAVVLGRLFPVLGREVDWSQITTGIEWKFILPSVVLAVSLFYAITVGPYMEIPGDPLWHMLKIGNAVEHWSTSEIWAFKIKKEVLTTPNYHWYHFCGWLISLTKTNFQQAMNSIWVVNFATFTTAFYWFAMRLFRDTKLSDLQRTWAAILAVVFLVLHFGIGPFSYVRYYVFAPSFMALIGYWSVLIVIWDFLSGRTGILKTVLLGGFLSFATMLLHHQEVLFIGVMAVLLTGAMFWRWLFSGTGYPWQDLGPRLRNSRSAQIICASFLLVIVGYLILHGYLYISRVRNYALEGGWLMPVSQTAPILKHLFILKPSGQFYQVLTVWGVWGYLAYFLHARKVAFPLVVAAGIWSPLWTVFNPVFIDFFLRMTYPEVVWRLVYIVPMELALALLVVTWWADFSMKKIQSSKLGVIISGLFIILSFTLLWPFNTSFVNNQYDKFGMLKSVNEDMDQRLLNDLITHLERISKTQVLTDQITGYVVNAFTKHQYNGH